MSKPEIFLILLLLFTISHHVSASPQNPGYYAIDDYEFQAVKINTSGYLPLPQLNITDRVTLISISLDLSLVNHTISQDLEDITELFNSIPEGINFPGRYGNRSHFIAVDAVLSKAILINQNVTIDPYNVMFTYLDEPHNQRSELLTMDNDYEYTDWHALGPGASVVLWIYSKQDYDVSMNWYQKSFNFTIEANKTNVIRFSLDNDTSKLGNNEDKWKEHVIIDYNPNISSYFALSPNNGQGSAYYPENFFPIKFDMVVLSIAMVVIVKRTRNGQ